ncbi:DNA-binding transcriptional regulator, MarR family [Sanguibacter gelidistatuariae]|uniref:DNA-binding transcriptional regulator, MarR family n=1 Tax=Sanguibacter gelidistatuariae TaxID=1814289 RepID=A0A1G6WG49_9MICO|nr:MarR family winged helix-turn-helix transcriptional regulator [Sanguibacter gelidistatuariae]SDD64036.1 DNA-binding transcriptional regulator, MarR family [Sanguibacter gelidistatuariae]
MSLDPRSSTGFHLWAVARAWQQLRQQSLRALGITHSEFVTLVGVVWLEAQGQAVNQQSVSDYVGIDKGSISLSLNSLDRKGMIERRPDPSDRRARRLAATPQGRAIARRSIDEALTDNASFFAGLDEQEATLNQLLRRLEPADIAANPPTGAHPEGEDPDHDRT